MRISDRGVKGRRVRWQGAEWIVTGRVVYSNADVISLRRGARPFTASVARADVKFVQGDYTARGKRA